jgi:hypothetical protein
MTFEKAFIKLKQGKSIKLNTPGNKIRYEKKGENLVMTDGVSEKDGIFTGEMLLSNQWIVE